MNNEEKKPEVIFQEIQSWEQGPITEILGGSPRSSEQSTKSVIVYGPTQVGKTTLIIDLIGVRTERQKELENILRGGANYGTSSTSTAIIYNRWSDSQFGIRLGNLDGEGTREPERCNAEEMRNKIARINMGNRLGTTEDAQSKRKGDILYYYIPDEFFDEHTEDDRLQVVDLPGFGERGQLMNKKADEIIDFFSGIVSGAIIVVRSENIQRLESDYKKFISRHHQSNLAIAVSFALKTSSSLKNQIVQWEMDGKSDEELARLFAKYYHDLIKNERYMTFDETVSEQIVFPVEHSGYLAEEYPHLIGAFDQSRKLLRERIKGMQNRTAIQSCLDELTKRNQKLADQMQTEQQKVADLTAKHAQTTIQHEEAASEVVSGRLAVEREQKAYDTWKTAWSTMQNRVESISSMPLTTEQAREIWNACSAKQKDTLYERFRTLFEERLSCFKTENSLHTRMMRTVDEVLGSMNFDALLKKRDSCGLFGLGREFGEKSREYVRSQAAETAYTIKTKLTPSVRSYGREQTSDLEKAVKSAKDRYYQAERARSIYEQELSDLEQQIRESEARTLEYAADIGSNTKKRESVKKVFAKYYYEKEAELLERINQETDTETKMSLVLTLSAIHLTMKPYLKELADEQT